MERRWGGKSPEKRYSSIEDLSTLFRATRFGSPLCKLLVKSENIHTSTKLKPFKHLKRFEHPKTQKKPLFDIISLIVLQKMIRRNKNDLFELRSPKPKKQIILFSKSILCGASKYGMFRQQAQTNSLFPVIL
ncbi:MAG TPA: hypothetical protein DCE42_03370 [Myxococcales bacterium]|nr:hypothetical protein [Myxococcales bacterium]